MFGYSFQSLKDPLTVSHQWVCAEEKAGGLNCQTQSAEGGIADEQNDTFFPFLSELLSRWLNLAIFPARINDKIQLGFKNWFKKKNKKSGHFRKIILAIVYIPVAVILRSNILFPDIFTPTYYNTVVIVYYCSIAVQLNSFALMPWSS